MRESRFQTSCQPRPANALRFAFNPGRKSGPARTLQHFFLCDLPCSLPDAALSGLCHKHPEYNSPFRPPSAWSGGALVPRWYHPIPIEHANSPLFNQASLSKSFSCGFSAAKRFSGLDVGCWMLDVQLTSLDHTIREGNSVISDKAVHPKAFDWQAAFPEVLAQGGFDVVVGNPPYIRQELLSPFKPWLEAHYEVFHGMADLYVYFYELGVRMLKPGLPKELPAPPCVKQICICHDLNSNPDIEAIPPEHYTL